MLCMWASVKSVPHGDLNSIGHSVDTLDIGLTYMCYGIGIIDVPFKCMGL